MQLRCKDVVEVGIFTLASRFSGSKLLEISIDQRFLVQKHRGSFFKVLSSFVKQRNCFFERTVHQRSDRAINLARGLLAV